MKLRFLIILLPLMMAACASEPTRPEPAGMQTVLVRPGETIDDLARRLGIAPQDLIEANRLTPPYKVSGGETLIVPVPKRYAVQKGDSLSKLAIRFNLSQSAIARLNHLSPPYTLRVGQLLRLPNFHGQDADTAVASAPEAQVTPLPPPIVKNTPVPPPVIAGKPTDRASPAALAPAVPAAKPAEPSPAEAASGFLWPVKGEIVSSFGPKSGGLHNDGINIAAAEGTPVKASAAGSVAYAGSDLKGFGNLILIRHADGYITAYAHLASMSVGKGETVKAGQQIGVVGQTGSVDSPQLHFELRHGKEAVDPTGKLG